MCWGIDIAASNEKPEVLLAREFADELGVEINPQALRMFVRARWARISTLTHAIHGAGQPAVGGNYIPRGLGQQYQQP